MFKTPDPPGGGTAPSAEVAINANVDVVSMNFRYSGAWAEYNQRMMARHHVINLYMTAATLSLGFLYIHREDNGFNFWEVALVLPVASAVASALLYMHDCMMCNLHDFMIKCEQWHNGPGRGAGRLLGYHASPLGVQRFLTNRQLQDYTIIGIYAIINLSPFYLLPGKTRLSILMRPGHWGAYAVLYVGCLLMAWVLVLEAKDRRAEAVRGHYEDCRVTGAAGRARNFCQRVLLKYLLRKKFKRAA